MPYVSVGTERALVDEADLPLIQAWQWHVHRTKTILYARGYPKGTPRAGARLFYMHRVLLGAIGTQEVDHSNGNGLDNRRCNLRFCTRSENNANRYAVQSKTSRHKGVHFDRRTSAWRAEIMRDGVRYRLGRFPTESRAAEAYDRKARELYPGFGHGSTTSS